MVNPFFPRLLIARNLTARNLLWAGWLEAAFGPELRGEKGVEESPRSFLQPLRDAISGGDLGPMQLLIAPCETLPPWLFVRVSIVPELTGHERR